MSDNKINPVVEIKSGNEIFTNVEFPALESIKKHIDKPHGLSLIAMSMIDNIRDLEIRFDTTDYIDTIINYLVGVWLEYAPIPCMIRSYKKNNIFQDTVDFISEPIDKLQACDSVPSTVNDFNNKKVIIDIASNNGVYTIKFYKWNEGAERRLIIRSKSTIEPLATIADAIFANIE